jgi:hypothetical protein
MNNNLVSIEKLKSVAKQKNIYKYIKEIGYSKAKNKKYYIITIDNKRVNFGYSKMEDYLIHRDKIRRERFLKRFEKLFNKFKNDYNRPIFWTVYLLW